MDELKRDPTHALAVIVIVLKEKEEGLLKQKAAETPRWAKVCEENYAKSMDYAIWR